MDAKRVVLVSVVVTGTVAAVGQFAQLKTPSLRMGVGLLFAGVVLSAGAEVAPDLAQGFAVLMMATTVFVYGGPAFAGVNRVVANAAPAQTPTSARRTAS